MNTCKNRKRDKLDSLISLQRQISLFNSVLCNDHQLQTVTDLNVSLSGTGESVHDNLFNVLLRQGFRNAGLQGVALAGAGNVLVLEVDLVVEERHDQARGSTSGTALFSFVAAYRVVGVKGTLAVGIDSTKNGVDVVGEETLVVEDVGETLGAGGNGHGLVVAVVVHLDDGVELLGQSIAIGGETNDGENNAGALLLRALAADAEQLRGVAGVDVVAGGVAGVTSHDGEIGT